MLFYIRWLSILGFSAIIIFLMVRIYAKKSTSDRLKIMPNLNAVELTKRSSFHSFKDSISARKVLIFFKSECSYCQDKAASIRSNIEFFKDSIVIFVSDDSEKCIIDFSKEFQLFESKNVYWLKMSPEEVSKTFGSISVPNIWIYDNEGILIKEFGGNVRMTDILELM